MTAYKLVRYRKNGTLAPLFIDASFTYPVGEWITAKRGIFKDGFTYRPGFHCTQRPVAPHLSGKNRVWVRCELADYEEVLRPERQGGMWYLAQRMKILGIDWDQVERVPIATKAAAFLHNCGFNVVSPEYREMLVARTEYRKGV